MRALILALAMLLATPSPTISIDHLGCKPYRITEYSPTGVVGCVVYGTGLASWWSGPGAARNDCVWPWTDCQTITIQSVETGLSIVVTPTMFCDCYTTTADERIVDLDPSMVAALGLNPAQGLFPVIVLPLDGATLPNTAMHP